MGLTVIGDMRPRVVAGRYYIAVQGASAVCE